MTALLFGVSVTPSFATTFTDDFNDGNADGWDFVNPGWSVEDGSLKQLDSGGALALIDNYQFSNFF